MIFEHFKIKHPHKQKKSTSTRENDLMPDQVISYNSKMGQHQEIYHFQVL